MDSTGRCNTSMMRSCCGTTQETTCGGSGHPAGDAVAWPADCGAQGGSAAVLEGDRSRLAQRGRRGGMRRVAGGRGAVVPRDWGHVADHFGPDLGALLVVGRERRLPCSKRRTVAFETLPAGSAATREQSPESCAATPLPVAAGWSIGPRQRSGMPSGGPGAPRPRNSLRTRRCASTCSNGFPGSSRLQTAA